MALAAGLVLVAVVLIGILLLTGGDDAGDNAPAALATPGRGTATATSANASPTSRSGLAQSTGTSPAASTAVAPTATTAPDAPTATSEEPAQTPENTETGAPSDEEPLIGDFGPLPPAQVVSGGVTRNLSLDYQLGVSLDEVPSTGTVYRLEWPEWTEAEVQALAESLGIDGVVQDLGSHYRVTGTGAELFVQPNMVQYYSEQATTGELEGDETLIAAARSWLSQHGLTGDDAGEGSVIGRDETSGRAIVLVKPAAPAPLLAFYPSASVTLGPGGVVLEANVRWPAGYTPSEYGLRDPDELWNAVLAGEGALEADLSGVGGDGPLSGTLTVTSIGLAWSYAGSPGNVEFLVPLVVFSGEAVFDDGEGSAPVSIYLPAVAGEGSARG